MRLQVKLEYREPGCGAKISAAPFWVPDTVHGAACALLFRAPLHNLPHECERIESTQFCAIG